MNSYMDGVIPRFQLQVNVNVLFTELVFNLLSLSLKQNSYPSIMLLSIILVFDSYVKKALRTLANS